MDNIRRKLDAQHAIDTTAGVTSGFNANMPWDKVFLVAANDKEFIHEFSELLRETHNLKIDQSVLDNMLQSLHRTSASTNSTSTRNKVTFVLALLAERKFLINLVRSLLRLVLQATTA